MNFSARGFTIIEWTIYFFLVMVVVTGIFHYVVGVRHHLVAMGRQSGALSQLCAAQDACVRDLQGASNEVAYWHELGPESLAWQKGHIIYCWAVESGLLVRREKVFDPLKKSWKSLHKSVVTHGHVEFVVVPIYAPQKTQDKEQIVVGMELCFSCEELGQKVRVQKTVTFKNGRAL